MQIKYPETYLVWDLETSGLSFKDDKILEIGFAEVVDGKIETWGSWLLKHEGFVVPEEITAINGITQAMIDEKGVDPEFAMKEFLNIFHHHSAHLTHNGIRFDIPFFAEQSRQLFGWDDEIYNSFLKRANNYAIDSAAMYKGRFVLSRPRMWNQSFYEWAKDVLEQRAYGKYNVGHCCDELGIDRSQTVQHRASGDVSLTNEIYKKLIETP